MKTKGYKLFVDDLRPIPQGWIGARTVSEAIAILAQIPVYALSLDHDILMPEGRNGDGYTPLLNETYRGVAYYVAAMPQDHRPAYIRVHTANGGAAKTMCDIMGIPFPESYAPYDVGNYGDPAKVQ